MADDKAVTSIEYALITAGIAVAIAAVLPMVAGALQTTFRLVLAAL